MAEKFLILGASSFYGRNFAECVERHGDAAEIPPVGWRLGDKLPPNSSKNIVNFASRSAVAESWLDPLGWLAINTALTTFLITQAMEQNCKRFVHVSTPESYGSTEGWVDETYAAWKPSTPYAVSRAAADMMLMAYHRAYHFPAIITRTANIYGPGQQDYRIIPKAFSEIRAGKRLPLHGGGGSRRSFIHVKDACEGLYKVCKEGDAGQTYHISTERQVSIAELVGMIAKLCERRFEDCTERAPDRLGKDEAYLLNSAKLRRMGWRDTISLETGLEEYRAWKP